MFSSGSESMPGKLLEQELKTCPNLKRNKVHHVCLLIVMFINRINSYAFGTNFCEKVMQIRFESTTSLG